MAKYTHRQWVEYCEYCWLADCDITEFSNCEIGQISTLTNVFNHLDYLYNKNCKIADYKDPFFYIRSYELDKRKDHA